MKALTRHLLATSVCALAIASSACAGTQKTNLTTTAQNPAAKGTVETKRTPNANTAVEVKVDYMAPPQAIANDASVYVVWAKPLTLPDAPPQNVGALVVDKNRKGELKTTTPHSKFELFVTPEPSKEVTQPTHEPVMKAKIAPKE